MSFRLNAGIPLGIQQPDIVNTLARSDQARAVRGEEQQRNALRDFLRTEGGALYAGDSEALGRYAQFDPQAAFGMKAQQERLQMDRERLQLSRQAAARAGAAAARNAAERASLAEQIRAGKLAMIQGKQALDAGDEQGWNAFLGAIGAPAMPMETQSLMLAGELLGGLEEGFMGALHGPEADYKVVGNQLYDLNAEGGPAVVGSGEGSRPTFSVTMPDGTEVSYGSNGAIRGAEPLPTDPNKLGTEISKDDADLLKGANEQAAAADSLNLQLTRAESILPEIDTGAAAPAKAFASKVGAVLGLSDGSTAATFEELESVSKTIGIDTLKAVGGNDTERELLTAIQTTVSPTKEDAANAAILADQKAAIDTIREKPTIMSEWISRYGSTSNPNENGESFAQFWGQYQLQQFNARRGEYRQSIGISGSPATGMTFEQFSAMPDAQAAASNSGLTLEEIWRYHPDNPEAQ